MIFVGEWTRQLRGGPALFDNWIRIDCGLRVSVHAEPRMSPSSNKPPACPRTPWTISDYLQMFLVDQSCENCASLARSVTRFSSTEVGCFICLLRIRVHGNRFADKLGRSERSALMTDQLFLPSALQSLCFFVFLESMQHGRCTQDQL